MRSFRKLRSRIVYVGKYRDWSPKFETGLNIIIGIVQKVEE